MHYHLGLVCSHCMDYFTTSTDAMCWHAQLCKLVAAGINDDDQEEEFEDDDNSCKYDDEFAFNED